MAISETITIDAGPAIAQLNEVAEAAGKAAAALDKLKAGGASGAGADKLAASMDKAAASISAAVDKINAAMDKIGGSADAAAAGIDRLGSAADVAGAGLDRAAAGADAAAAANERLAGAADAGAAATERQAAAGKDVNEGFLSKHKELLLGTAVVMGYAVDKAMKFNSQMTLLQTQAGVSAKEMPQLTKGVLELAGATGQSPGNLAESLYHVESNMQSLGIKAPQALNLVKVAAEGASVGHANLVDVTNALTASVASGIPGVKNMSQAMGVLNATVGSGDMNMQDLADAFGTGAVASVKGYGLNIKDVGAALAVFGDNNIRGAKAGTDLRMSVQALAVPAASAKDELKKLGLTQTSLADDMKSGGLLKALDDLSARFKANGIGAKEQGQVITDLFGKKAGVGLSILLGQMDRLQSKYPDLTKGADSFGKAWDKTLDTPQQKLKNLEAGAQALAITAGNVLMPAASGLLGGLDKAFSFIQGNAFASKGLAIGAGGLVAGGLAKGLFSGVESGLSGLGKIGSALKIPGADKLANIGQSSGLNGAAGNLEGAGASLKGAAASLDEAAGKLGAAGTEGGLGGGAGAAGKAEGEAATAAEGAGAGGLFSKIGRGGASTLGALQAASGTIGGGLILGELIRGLGDQLSPKGTNAGRVNEALQRQAAQAPSTLHPYVLGGLESKAATSSIGLEIGGAIGRALTQRAPAAPAAIRESGATPAMAARFGPAGAGPAPKVTPEVDTSKAKSALSGFTSMLASAMSKPVKMPPPDISALTGAKGKAQADAQAIQQSIDNALKKPAKAAQPDLSAYKAAVGPAHADGVSISQGLASGIEAGKGAVVAAASDVASAAAAAMANAVQSHSPSKVTEKIGKDTAQGLVVGLEGGKSAVDAAATALGKNAAKATDIASIDNTIAKLMKDVPSGDTGLTKMLKADQSKLTSLANQRTALEAQIKDAQQISQQAIANADITQAGSYQSPLATAGGPLAASATISGMQAQAADAKQFAQTVAQLKKQGLNATSLNQIVQAGPSALPMAQGLAQGGKQAVQQVNQLEGQIKGSAAKLGNIGAGPMYQAGIAVTQGLAQGIKAGLSSVDAAIAQLAAKVVADIKKALKSSSPAQVMVEPGMSIPQGVALGIERGTSTATAAMGRMSKSLQMTPYQPSMAYAHPAAGGSSGGGGGGDTHIHVNVQGSLIHQNDLASHLQDTMNGLALRNWQGGIKVPGRAS